MEDSWWRWWLNEFIQCFHFYKWKYLRKHCTIKCCSFVTRAIARYVGYVLPHKASFSIGALFQREFSLRQKVTEEIGIHSDFPMKRKQKTKVNFFEWGRVPILSLAPGVILPCYGPIVTTLLKLIISQPIIIHELHRLFKWFKHFWHHLIYSQQILRWLISGHWGSRK